MFRFSNTQIDLIKDASVEQFVANAVEPVRAAGVDLPQTEIENHIREVAQFCVRSNINSPALIEMVAVANYQFEIATPLPDSLILILKRDGFSEIERVEAYLTVLGGTRRRVTLEQLRMKR